MQIVLQTIEMTLYKMPMLMLLWSRKAYKHEHAQIIVKKI